MILCGLAGAVAPAGARATDPLPASTPYWLLHGPGVTSFGAFAGYVWSGHVHSVGASWTIPAVQAGSHGGKAGTWIGAQVPGGRRAPFIQVGTNEEYLSGPTDGVAFDYAFFSDTDLSFHPSFLFPVGIGDLLSASLRLYGGRWHVAIVDRTRGRHDTFTTRDETGATFDEAEWLEEDVHTSTGGVFPYPRLSAVHFRHLRVDSGVPRQARLSSAWMSENHEDLAPSPLVGDAFGLAPAQLTAIGEHYLQIAVLLDLALRTFGEDLARWTPQTPARTVTAQRRAAAAAIESYLESLAGTAWPVPAQGVCDRLIAATKADLARARSAPSLTASGIKRWTAGLAKAGSAVSRLAHRLRRTLGVPQLTPLPG